MFWRRKSGNGSVQNRCLLDDGQKAKNNELSSKSTFGGDSTTALDTSRSVHFCVASRTLERPKIQISYFRARVSELGVCLSVLAAATSATAKNLQIPLVR